MPPMTRVIDFHSHYYEPSWSSSASTRTPKVLSQAWPLLTNLEAQLTEMEVAGIDAKVLSAPAAVLVDPGQPLSPDLMMRINDRFAELVATYPERLFALATIDAFQDDVAAGEVERTIQTLGLHGICIDCAQADRYLDVPEVRPTLVAAAALGVPVFVHPVSPIGFTKRLERLGHTGVLLARGTEDAASVLTLLQSGVFDELPDLKVVVPMIGIAALFFAGMAEQDYQREESWRGSSPAMTRQRLYVDTMGFDLPTIHFAMELLGKEHVLLGSDWPIMPITPRSRLEELCMTLHLTETQKAALLGGNVQRLFTRHTP